MVDLDYLTRDMFRADIVATVDGREHLIGSRCGRCGDIRFPPAVGCPSCQASADDLERIPLPRTGVVAAATRVERAIPPFEPPYVLAYVQLADGVRVFCQLRADSDEPAALIGRECQLVIGELYKKEGGPVRGYLFEVTS
jgi:hypothetical protein